MSQELSMAARREITKKYARAYGVASKGEKGRLLTELCASTGWSRDNARRAIRNAGKRKGKPSQQTRKPRGFGYSYDARKVLIEIWSMAGEPSGKYLHPVLGEHLQMLQAHGELERVAPRLTDEVRAELLSMSAATIDRYLKPTRDARRKLTGKSTTKPGNMLRESIPVRPASAPTEAVPGFFEVDLVAHCGHSIEGHYAHTLTATDVHTGWTVPVALPNKAHRWAKENIEYIADTLPYAMTGIDSDNGGEFINHQLADWTIARKIAMTRGRPHRSNDNAHVEQRNGDWVRRYGFRFRYDTEAELALLDQLWELVGLQKNYLLPTKKATGWTTTKAGRSRRTYDWPRTPFQRVLDSSVLTDPQVHELSAIRAELNPAAITRGILSIQQELIRSATMKTRAQRAAA
jgi:hypothetical protein